MKQAVLRSHLPRGVWPREGYTWVTSLTSVGDTNSTLGDTNSTLGDINSTLGDINSTLGDSTTVSRIIEKKKRPPLNNSAQGHDNITLPCLRGGAVVSCTSQCTALHHCTGWVRVGRIISSRHECNLSSWKDN